MEKTKTEKSGEKKKVKRRPPPQPPGLKDDITVLAHFAVLIYVVIICYLCFSKPFTFFTWHPLLMSIGWALLTSEAVLFISKENPLSRLTRTWKLRWHWALLTLAAVFIAVGFAVAVINKTNLNKQHFKSWHATFGLLAAIGFIPPVINGIPALYDVDLKAYIKPNYVKTVHQASGTAGYIFGGLALILSVYTKWFANYSENNKYVFLIALISVTFSFVWALQRPFLKCLRKVLKVPF